MKLKSTLSLSILTFLLLLPLQAQKLITDVTLTTRYMAHGLDVGGQNLEALQVDAIVPIVKDLAFVAWANFPLDRHFNENDEVDLLFNYKMSSKSKSRFLIAPNGYFDYWFFQNNKCTKDIHGNALNNAMLQGFKVNLGISMPNILPIGNTTIVPAYNYYYWTPLGGKTFYAAGIHEFTLNSSLPVKFGDTKQNLDLGLSSDYSEQNALGNDKGWTNVACHAGTTLRAGSWSLTPSVHYQWSFAANAVNHNQFWFKMNIGKAF